MTISSTCCCTAVLPIVAHLLKHCLPLLLACRDRKPPQPLSRGSDQAFWSAPSPSNPAVIMLQASDSHGRSLLERLKALQDRLGPALSSMTLRPALTARQALRQLQQQMDGLGPDVQVGPSQQRLPMLWSLSALA